MGMVRNRWISFVSFSLTSLSAFSASVFFWYSSASERVLSSPSSWRITFICSRRMYSFWFLSISALTFSWNSFFMEKISISMVSVFTTISYRSVREPCSKMDWRMV